MSCRKQSHVKLAPQCTGHSNPTERSEQAHCARPRPCLLFAPMVEITCQSVSYAKQQGACETVMCVCASYVNTSTRHRVSKHGGRVTPEMSQYNALFLLIHYVINRAGTGGLKSLKSLNQKRLSLLLYWHQEDRNISQREESESSGSILVTQRHDEMNPFQSRSRIICVYITLSTTVCFLMTVFTFSF